jgi:glycerophosphoryl diester phosphodiesterase
MWNDLPLPCIIAHRGDKAHAPENTLAAFKIAADVGADAIEFDVKLSADGRVVVIHDQSVDRTTDGTGNVSKLGLAALQHLDAGGWFSDQYRGERIPTLDEVFELAGNRLYFNIELTNYATPRDDLVENVVEIVKHHHVEERSLFSSFFNHNLDKARVLLPQVPRGLLTLPGLAGWWGRTFAWRGDYYALHPALNDTSPGLIDRVHAAGKRVQVWTVNCNDDLKKVIGFGVDAIFTDDPGSALRLLERSNGNTEAI